MPLQEGTIYRTPDGRRLRAVSENRRYHAERAWTLVPTDIANESTSHRSSREHLEASLFVEGDRLFRIVFEDRPTVQETGWTVSDLIKEPEA